jgi:polysaccharide deacetylase 2 family uncharacterized protein YibQ
MHAPRIAIILDDFGYNQILDQRAISLPFALTCSVIPDSPHGPEMARRAHAAGKEVMLHIPMATLSHRRLDPGGLHEGVTQNQLDAILQQAITSLPEAVGVNNHMGSLLTSEPRPMTWLMQKLAHAHLFFIDSRTTARSVAEKVALEQGVPARSRDVFLDDRQEAGYINQQFNHLLDIARERGSAIAIGHPYAATLEYLSQVLPQLKRTGVTLVPVSALLPSQPGTANSTNIQQTNIGH